MPPIGAFSIGSTPIGGGRIPAQPRPELDPIKYYLNLVTSQYQNSPKFMAQLGAFIRIVEDINVLAKSIDAAFDIDNAVGVQLDVCGQIVGLSRTLISNSWGGTGSKFTANDSNYLTLLKATIAKNSWDGKKDSLQPTWQSLFPDFNLLIQDNQDMTEWVIALSDGLGFELLLYLFNNKIVPIPEGVWPTYYICNGPTAVGFGVNNAYITGFGGEGTWARPVAVEPPAFGFDRMDSFVAGFGYGQWTPNIEENNT